MENVEKGRDNLAGYLLGGRGKLETLHKLGWGIRGGGVLFSSWKRFSCLSKLKYLVSPAERDILESYLELVYEDIQTYTQTS